MAERMRDGPGARNQSAWVPWLLGIGMAALLVTFPLLVEGGSRRNVAILVLLYAGLAQAWNILGGFAGQISLGNAAFLGIGAYTSTVMLDRWNVSPWIGMGCGAVLAALFAVIVGYPIFRLGGHYFAIATIALAEIMVILFANWEYVGGAVGISIPFIRGPDRRPVDSWEFLQFNESRVPYYYITLAMTALVTLTALIIERTKPGYYFRAIKNDPLAARALGVSVLKYKLFAIVISAAFTAMFGTIYAQYLLFIDPETTMRLELSVLIALVAILGGVGTAAGPLIGAAVMIPLSEYSRGQFGGSGNALDLVLYGGMVVLVSIFQPNGLIAIWRRWRGRQLSRATPLPATSQQEARDEKPLVGTAETDH
ncbi:MAG: branched-chain amino acid ABC transporter permease [Thermomicrobiales bacterium]